MVLHQYHTFSGERNQPFVPFLIANAPYSFPVTCIVFFRLFVHVVPVCVLCHILFHGAERMPLFAPDQSLNGTMLLSLMPLFPPFPICAYLMFPTTKPKSEALMSPALVRERTEPDESCRHHPLHSESLENNIASEPSVTDQQWL